MPTDNSIVAGSSGVFQETPQPAGSVFPAGTVIKFAADDPAVVISDSPDGDSSKTVAAVPAGDTNASFQLASQATGTDSNGNPFTVNGTPLTVIIRQSQPPPPSLPTGMTLAQLS